MIVQLRYGKIHRTSFRAGAGGHDLRGDDLRGDDLQGDDLQGDRSGIDRARRSALVNGVVQGEYHWHKHDDDDEFFCVLEGRLLIDLESGKVELAPRTGFVVPKGFTYY